LEFPIDKELLLEDDIADSDDDYCDDDYCDDKSLSEVIANEKVAILKNSTQRQLN